jgi:hypothetical protein
MMMIDAEHPPLTPAGAAPAAQDVDLALRAFLLGVLTRVALGLVLAGAVAYAASTVPIIRDQLFSLRGAGGHPAVGFTVLGVAAAVSPLLALGLFGGGPQTRLRSALLFWSVAASIGASFGAVLLVYTGVSIATTFAAAAAGFGALCLFGYTTRRDLGALRAFLTTGLVGLIAALGLNLLLGSAALAFALNIVGVLVFAGLVAHDLQYIKLMHHRARAAGADLAIAANTGALCLFLDFVNVYQFLLLASGQRR